MHNLPPTRDDCAISAINGSAGDPIRTSSNRGIPEFSDLLIACRHHLLLTMVVGSVAASLLAAIAWSVVKPSYHAEGLVRVREQQNVIFAAQTSRAEDVSFFRSQAKLVKSHQVLEAALKDKSIQEIGYAIPDGGEIEWVAGLLRVETQSGSEVMSISIRHQSAEVSQALCNAITNAYMAEITHRLTSDRQSREKQLERAAMVADQHLDRLWEELNTLAQSVGSDSSESLTIRDEMQSQAYRDHTRQLQAAQLRSNQLQSRLADIQASANRGNIDETSIAESALLQNPQIIEARQRLMQANLQYEQMREIAASDDSPPMRRIAQQRHFLTVELEKLSSAVRTDLQQNIEKKMHTDQNETLVKLKQEIELNRSEKEFLRDRLSEFNPIVAKTNHKSAVPLDVSRHAIDRQARLADSLWKALQEFRIEGQSQPRVTLQELAKLPKHASHSRQLKAAVGAGTTGWMLILFMIGYVEWRDCRVRTPDDVSLRSRHPVFGVNSYAALQSRKWFSFKKRQMSSGVREAAARILLCDKAAPTRTLMVTSCVAGEPRHLVSQELVVLLGGFGRRVLLIDCDTDHSKLSDSLGASRSVGIRQLPASDTLDNPEAISQLLVSTNEENVDFLPVGPIEDRLSWIDPRTLRSVIRNLRDQYEAIIVNGPSIMGSAEGVLLAAEVDSSVLAISVNGSRWNQIVICEESAQQAGISISGTIMHRGTGKSGLQLQPNRPRVTRPAVAASQFTRAEESTDPKQVVDEDLLRNEIEELQREVRRIQTSDSKTTVTETSADPLQQSDKVGKK